MGVLQQLHDLHLSEDLFKVLIVQLSLIHYFYSHLETEREERDGRREIRMNETGCGGVERRERSREESSVGRKESWTKEMVMGVRKNEQAQSNETIHLLTLLIKHRYDINMNVIKLTIKPRQQCQSTSSASRDPSVMTQTP